MEIPPEDITPVKLSQKLVNKHRKMAKTYKKESDARQKILVLNEKKDQLEYWISSAQDESSNGYKKYLGEKKYADEELQELTNGLREIFPQFSVKESKKSMAERHAFLKDQISSHTEATVYWKTRMKEFEQEGENERKGAEEEH